MDVARVFRVRVLGLGVEGERALPSVVRCVEALWKRLGDLEVVGVAGGDDARSVALTLRRWCDRDGVEVVLTVGRSGPDREDFAPEITAPLLDRVLHGIEERMCLAPPVRPDDLLFRGRAGLRRGTLLVNLPGGAARARRIVGFLGPVVGHAVEKTRGSDRECAAAGLPR